MIVNIAAWTVIWSILGIVGMLLAISKIGFKKRIDRRIGIGLTLTGVSLFCLAIGLPQHGIAFSIIGTLIIAGAALMAIRQSAEKARIDKRERKLIDIITWTNEVVKCETVTSLTPLPALELHRSVARLGKERVESIFAYHERNRRVNLIMRYQNLEVVSPRIVLMTKQLDKELGSNLELLAQQSAEKLEEHVKLGGEFVGGKMSDEEYKQRWESLVGSATALAAKAEELI